MTGPNARKALVSFLLTALIAAAIPTVDDARAKCRRVKRGGQTYLECDDDASRHDREYICDRSTSRDRRGTPMSVTTFCRPDGSIWKKIVVKPAVVEVTQFRKDGSIAWREKYPSDARHERSSAANRSGAPVPGRNIHIRYRGHFSRIGDSKFIGQAGTLGDPGGKSQLEGYRIELAGHSKPIRLRYMAHISGIGDVSWVGMGEFCGTKGQSKGIEGVAIDRAGAHTADTFDVVYRAHIMGQGWTNWCRNGEFCGSRGKGRPLNALQIVITDK